ncbi:hypothetical protein ABC383_00635 [Noviherbaspirillum sp. 1P10PC]
MNPHVPDRTCHVVSFTCTLGAGHAKALARTQLPGASAAGTLIIKG